MLPQKKIQAKNNQKRRRPLILNKKVEKELIKIIKKTF